MKEFKLSGAPVLAPTRLALPLPPVAATLPTLRTPSLSLVTAAADAIPPPRPAVPLATAAAAARSLPSPHSFPPSPLSHALTDPPLGPQLSFNTGSALEYHDDGPGSDSDDHDDAADHASQASAQPSAKKQHAFPCTYAGCTKSYKRQCLLDEHLRTHTGEKPFTCPDCGKAFARQRNLQQHMPIHAATVPKPHACTRPGCTKTFRLKGQLRDHEQRHDVPKPFTCVEPGCTAAFAKHSQLRKHVAEHQGKLPYACTWDGCNMSFPTPSKLAKHVARHENPKSYVCPKPECALGFPTWSALQAHIRGDHPTPTAAIVAVGDATSPEASNASISAHALDAWPCPQCPKVLKSKYSRDQHVLKLHPVPGAPPPPTYPCTEPGCDKVLATKSSLRLHVRTLHLGIKPVECPECGRGFATRAFMDRHFASAHGPKKVVRAPPKKRKRSEEECDDDNENGGEVDLIAELTGAPAAAASEHVRKHVCTQCPRRFLREYDLKRHVAAAHDTQSAGKGEVALGAGVVIGNDGWARVTVDGRTSEAKRRRVADREADGLLPSGLRPVRHASASAAAAASLPAEADAGEDGHASDSGSEFEMANDEMDEDED